jgi:hypothetical protein
MNNINQNQQKSLISTKGYPKENQPKSRKQSIVARRDPYKNQRKSTKIIDFSKEVPLWKSTKVNKNH